MKLSSISAAALAAALLAGCAVEPVVVRPVHAGVYVPPPGVTYVAPTYAMPAPGYVWMHHPRYGWGWHHPEHGWHYGWR
ncbi:MAG: hypothetical protein V4772_02925 [Pseudomonadota bacterium]